MGVVQKIRRGQISSGGRAGKNQTSNGNDPETGEGPQNYDGGNLQYRGTIPPQKLDYDGPSVIITRWNVVK